MTINFYEIPYRLQWLTSKQWLKIKNIYSLFLLGVIE